MDKTPISWQAYEYVHQEKSADWFWAVGIIAAAIAVTSILLHNIIFAVFIVLASFTLCLFAARHPKRFNFEINERGIVADRFQYPYQTIESFWVEENFGQPKLIIKSSKAFLPLVVLPIEEVDPSSIREFLSKKLHEVEHQEPLLQKIMEYLGF